MKIFQGLFTALVSPFFQGKLDEESFKSLLATQKNVDGVVIGGTTGESPTLSSLELDRLIQLTIENFRGKILVGAGANDTAKAIEKVKYLDQIPGIDGYLVVAPYYNKPNQRGVLEHFAAIAESTQRPIIIYSIPGRCGIEVAVNTVVQLRERYPNIAGIKEATDNCARVDDLVRQLPDDFFVLSGNDNMTLPFMAQGAVGVISASSNVIVTELKGLVDAALKGDFKQAQKLHIQNILKMRALFMEPNPVAIKHILSRKNIIRSGEVRLPLVASSEDNLRKIESFFE